MKDLKRLLIYGGSAAGAIFLLTILAESHALSGDAMVGLAVFLVIVLPIIVMIRLARREHDATRR